MQKIMVLIPADQFVHFSSDLKDDLLHTTGGIASYTVLDSGDYLAIIHPKSYGAMTILESYGCTVYPGPHAPNEIGDLHAHFKHVGAQPHHTMRHVHLELHKVHGPAFHPDR